MLLLVDDSRAAEAVYYRIKESVDELTTIRPMLCGDRAIFQRPSSSPSDTNDPYNERRKDNCRLHHYTTRDVVQCLSQIQDINWRRHQEQHNHSSSSLYHVAFVGESVERHQYYSFIEVRSVAAEE